jgi:DNA-binding GntR family transcriptional regulator
MRAPASARRLGAEAMTVRDVGTRLYAELHADIVAGRLRPGEALSETRVAARYGISRTPVREVFRRLVEDGLLHVLPQVGTFVAPIKLAAVVDSQFIREALECRAANRAATRATAAQVADLHRQIEQQGAAIAAGDRIRFFALDETMHGTILDIAGHAAVWTLIASVKAQLDRVRHLSLEDAAWLAMIYGQHRDIVERIAGGDGGGAERAMEAHLRTVFAAVERLAGTHAAFFEARALQTEELA